MPTSCHMNPVEWLVFLACLDYTRSIDYDAFPSVDKRTWHAAHNVIGWAMSRWRAATLDLSPLLEALKKPTN